MSELFGDESEDEIGKRPEKLRNYERKFSSFHNDRIQHLLNSRELLPGEMSSLCCDFEKLVLFSTSKSTWSKHCSAWKLYENFCEDFQVSFRLPIPVEFARAFVTWAACRKNLKSSTIKSYISSLNVAHTLSSTPNCNLNSDKCVKMALKGAENLSCLNFAVKPDRLPMNIHLLKILSHRLAETDWPKIEKQIIWTACTISFFTACRMGELVPFYEKGFDPATTLVWENVKFMENGDVLMFIPYCKTTGFNGKLLDIFRIEGNKFCPAASIIRLMKMVEKNAYFSQNIPVFSLPSGKNLTRKRLNFVLKNLLYDFTDENSKITGHSFRAAIPSALSSFPDENSMKDVKDWGSWESSSCDRYLKNERAKKKILFGKIVSCLNRV